MRRPAARARHHHRRPEHARPEQRLGRAHRHRPRRRPPHARGDPRLRPDVSTCTSRSRPAPTTPRWSARTMPAVGTFHSARVGPQRRGTTRFRAGLQPDAAPPRGRAPRCPSEAARQVAAHVRRPSARSCPTASRSTASRTAEPWPRPARPAIVFVGRHEPRKGLAVLLDAFARPRPRRRRCGSSGDGPQTAQLRDRELADVEWLGRISDDEKAAPAARRHRRVLPGDRRRVVRRRAARGDGGGRRGRGVRHRRLPRRSPATTSRRCWSPPGDADALARRAAPRSSTTTRAAARWSPPGAPAPTSSRWTHLAERFVEDLRAGDRRPRDELRRRPVVSRERRRGRRRAAPARARRRGRRCATRSSPLLGTAAARARVGRAPGRRRHAAHRRGRRAGGRGARSGAAGDVGFYSEDRGLVTYGQPARLPRDRPGRRHPARRPRGSSRAACRWRCRAAVGGRPPR